MPGKPWLSDGIRYAPAARSVADTVRELADLRLIRAVVADAVQRGRCSVPELSAELGSGPTRGSGGFRLALAEVADGVRSVVEGDLRTLIKKARLPAPLSELRHAIESGRRRPPLKVRTVSGVASRESARI
jgi:hypothetical protein